MVKVTLCAELVVATCCCPKPRLVGDKVTAGAVPVPVNGKLCGLSAALSLTVTLAVRIPAALGWNVTDNNDADAVACWSYACSLIDPKLALRGSPLFSKFGKKIFAENR